MSQKKDDNYDDSDHELESISDDGSISLGSEEDDQENYDEVDDLDDFIVDDDENTDLDGNPMTMEEVSKELDKELKVIGAPKLILNPYPTLNPNPNQESVKIPDEIKDEKERIKWLIKNKLGPGLTLEDYVKFLEQQEEEAVHNYVQRAKRRKLNNEDKK